MDSPHTETSLALERYEHKRTYTDVMLDRELARLREEVEILRKWQKQRWKEMDAWRDYLREYRKKHYGECY